MHRAMSLNSKQNEGFSETSNTGKHLKISTGCFLQFFIITILCSILPLSKHNNAMTPCFQHGFEHTCNIALHLFLLDPFHKADIDRLTAAGIFTMDRNRIHTLAKGLFGLSSNLLKNIIGCISLNLNG